jgi:predicted aspartyl protease
MSQHPFNPRASVLTFNCVARRGNLFVNLWMALDTGATWVMVAEQALQTLGYDLAHVATTVPFGDASLSHTAPLVILNAFGIAGAEEPDLECLAYTLPAAYGLDGVIGLNYMRRFRRVTLDFDGAMLLLER